MRIDLNRNLRIPTGIFGGQTGPQFLRADVLNEKPQKSDKQEMEFSDLPSADLRSSTHEFLKIVSFDTLTRCGDEIWIENSGQIYRLRRTKKGKLILTK